MKAPDGSYEAGLQVPGLPVFQQSKSVGDLDLNNPLSLHNDVRKLNESLYPC